MRLSQRDRVLSVAVQTGPFNYFTHRLQTELGQLVRAVHDDPSVGAVVVTGGIPERYLLHFDLAQVEQTLRDAPVVGQVEATALIGGARTMLEIGAEAALADSPLAGAATLAGFHRTALGILRSPAVWIAAVNGPCAGAGLEVTVFFDLRVAARDTATFSMPELSIALNPPLGGQRLAQLMNPSRALEFMLEARFYNATEAEFSGLINKAVPDGELLEIAHEMARRYAARPRGQVAAQKRIFNESHSWTVEDSLLREAATQMASATSPLFRDTVRCWLESRDHTAGDTVFLTDPAPWINGTALDLNSPSA